MNLLLVEHLQERYSFEAEDSRTAQILRLGGSEICVGIVNGPRGIGRFHREPKGAVSIERIRWEAERHLPPPVDLFVGLPRPAEARRILVQAAAMGVRRIGLMILDRTPPGYASSRSLQAEAVDRLLREGLEQGFHTALPDFRMVSGLSGLWSSVDPSGPVTVLDPYLGEDLLGEGGAAPDFPGTVVFGSERGFSPGEQRQIREADVRRRHLGPSILRTETAVVAALALAHRQVGFSRTSDRSVIRPD
ncbi:MAG: RsmE family RNA methyltransferase [Puniceicoccales bacterium]